MHGKTNETEDHTQLQGPAKEAKEHAQRQGQSKNRREHLQLQGRLETRNRDGALTHSAGGKDNDEHVAVAEANIRYTAKKNA